nr:hypothetical protein [Clostridium botulinum]
MKKSGFVKVIIAIVIFVVAFLSGSSIYKVIDNKKMGLLAHLNKIKELYKM